MPRFWIEYYAFDPPPLSNFVELNFVMPVIKILNQDKLNFPKDISEHVDLVSAMNDESLEGTLWAFELEMASLEKLLISFLKTRKEVFPKFALIPEPKLKSIFCSRSTDNINNWFVSFFRVNF